MKRILLVALSFVYLSCNKSDDEITTVEILPVVTEFKPNLSELNLYVGKLKNLSITPEAFEYKLKSSLFTDYAHKQRFVVLPQNTSMQYDGDGLPIFPENTLIAKTFYYNLNEGNTYAGKKIIETRILIKKEGVWITGNYKWNENQTDAVLNYDWSIVPITWIDLNGVEKSTDYRIPSNSQCFTCHNTNDVIKPIGLKLRTINQTFNGVNQLQTFINEQYLIGLSDISSVSVLPNYHDNNNYTLEERARAYFDINCAHCHSTGGYCQNNSPLRIHYETPFDDTQLAEQKNSLIYRISSNFQPGLTMPWIGTSMLHEEGVELMMEYINGL